MTTKPKQQRRALAQLILKARKIASVRNHDLARFAHGRQGDTAEATCKRCERRIAVSVKPGAPLDISGGAAIYECGNFTAQVRTIPVGQRNTRRPAAADPRKDRWHVRETDPCTLYDADGLMVGAIMDADDCALAARAPLQRTTLENALGALDSLLHQAEQMEGSFRDEDGTIEDAINDAKDAIDEIQFALGRKTEVERPNAPAHPDFPHVSWSRADQAQAEAEGWAIFETTSPVVLEIDCDDEAAIFADGEKAVEFVALRASEGSEFHARALAIHQLRPTKE